MERDATDTATGTIRGERPPELSPARSLDPDALSPADRALLRLLGRTGIVTAALAGSLVYPSRRRAQEHLVRLAQGGLLTRTTAGGHQRGQQAFVYALSRSAARRLHGQQPRLDRVHVRHDLDVIRAVGLLVQPLERDLRVELWLTETMARGVLGPGTRPDSIVVLDAPSGSGVLCLEIDEGTEHAPLIQSRLATYQRALSGRPNWSAVFAVNSVERLDWFLRLARRTDRATPSRAYVVHLSALEDGTDAVVHSLLTRDGGPLGSLLRDPHSRMTGTPVGSEAWIRLLGAGGAEPVGDSLRP